MRVRIVPLGQTPRGCGLAFPFPVCYNNRGRGVPMLAWLKDAAALILALLASLMVPAYIALMVGP